MLTAKKFATETGISYPVIIRWLKEERIPASRTSFGVWQIAPAMVKKFLRAGNRPKRGWPKGRKRTLTVKRER